MKKYFNSIYYSVRWKQLLKDFLKKFIYENEGSFENICKPTPNRLKTFFLLEDLF